MDSLTTGQKELLKTIKPLNEWIDYVEEYVETGNWSPIDNEFWQHCKTITFNEFYYAGKDLTNYINNDLDKVKYLESLYIAIVNKIPNSYHHEIAERLVINYRINDTTYDNAITQLNSILNLI